MTSAARDRHLRLEGCVLALAVRVGLRVLPLPRLVGLLERTPRARRRLHEPRACLDAARWAAGKVAHPTCLITSLVAYAMLLRRDHHAAFHVGVSPTPVFTAHAWLTLDSQPVDAGAPDYVPVWQPRAR